MFDQLSPRPSAVASRHGSPYAAELQRYVSHLMEEGRSPKTMLDIFRTLTAIDRHLPLDRATITLAEIEASADLWAATVHRSAKHIHVGKRAFICKRQTNACRVICGVFAPMRQG